MAIPSDFLTSIPWGQQPIAQPGGQGLVDQIANLFGGQQGQQPQAPPVDSPSMHYTPDRSFLNILRDVAGTVGDALVMRDGGNPLYQGNRIERKTSRAMGDDFATNPLAAIQRLQEAGLPQEAQAMDARRLAQEQVRNQTRASEALIRQRDAQAERYRNAGVQLLSQLSQGITDQATLDAARARADSIMARFGLDEAFSLPEVYSNENMASWRSMGITPYQSGQLGLGADRIETTKRGQDITSETQRRGQDVSSATTRRGQDIAATTSRGNNTQTNQTRLATDNDSGGRAGRRGNSLAGAPPAPAQDGLPLMKNGVMVAVSRGGKWIPNN